MKFLQNSNTSQIKANSQTCQDLIREEINQSSMDDCQEKSSYFNRVPHLSRKVDQWIQSSNIEQTHNGKRLAVKQNDNSHRLETDNYRPNKQNIDLAGQDNKPHEFPENLSKPPPGSVLQPKFQTNRHSSPDSIFSKESLRDNREMRFLKPTSKSTESGMNPSQDSKSTSTFESCQKKGEIFDQKMIDKLSQTGLVDKNTVRSMRSDHDIRIKPKISSNPKLCREGNENNMSDNTNDAEGTIVEDGRKSSQHNHTELRKDSVIMNDTKTPKVPLKSVALSSTCRKVKKPSRIERSATTIPILDSYHVHGALEGKTWSDLKDSNTKKHSLYAHKLIEQCPIETSYIKPTKDYTKRFIELSTPKKTVHIDLSADLSRMNYDENRNFYTSLSRDTRSGGSLENRKPTQALILDADLEYSENVLPSPFEDYLPEALKINSNNYTSYNTCKSESRQSTGLDMRSNYLENNEPCFISQVQYHHGENSDFLPQNTCSSNEDMRLYDNIWLSQAPDKLTNQGEDIQVNNTGKIQHLSDCFIQGIERDDSTMLCGPEIAESEEFDSRTTNMVDTNNVNLQGSPCNFIFRKSSISPANHNAAEKSPQYFGQNLLPIFDCDPDETVMVDFWKINRPSYSKDC
ncbi:BgtAc-30462 [Blumeria graminis f. sp. tritici]|uniref:BgtAc-30462 n=2 Tax=Blumeria graminis f. sp. tritici TaxID=62690 RepID=A0A9X9MK71_BLUGR|nr:hypothetical protein BGT96224_Ac30462 [Blumeria graminis f. sp. tritici 96224]VDB90738.1 BgtAc-30462 [Blumeria graminis f. sp. tritici]